VDKDTLDYRKGKIDCEKESYPFDITAITYPNVFLQANRGTESQKTSNPYHVA